MRKQSRGLNVVVDTELRFLEQAFAQGGLEAVERCWRQRILGDGALRDALVRHYHMPRLIAETRAIIAPAEDVKHTESSGYYWIEELSARIYAGLNDSLHDNGDDGLAEDEPHEQTLANIVRATIDAIQN